MLLRTCWSTVVALSFLLTGADAAAAETVKITGLHLCCGGCVAAAEEALADVTGLSDLEVDQELRTATFSADDEKAIAAAGAALLDAGFFGEIERAGKKSPPAIPENARIASGTKADRAVFDNVHLCCKNCSRGVTNALAKVREVVAVDCDTKAHTVTLTGKEMDLAAVADALHAGGFHGVLRRESAGNTAQAPAPGQAKKPR